MPPRKAALPDIFDLIVVGAGHAGCEAAMAAARLGLKTLLLTINLDRIGHLSCNPAVGGLAKGHLVKEIDALGGCQGLWADEASIQFRTLNTRKGPAVRSTRSQVDRIAYLAVVQRDIFGQDNLWVRQDTAAQVLAQDGKACGVLTQLGERHASRHVLLTTGTFLSGLMHIGLESFPGGRQGDPPANSLSASLREHGLELGRLKTGTTPRILKDSIDFAGLEVQHGDDPVPYFSFLSSGAPRMPQLPCHVTWTTRQTHDTIRSGLDRSPMYTGVITGVGARYCPSIEDKIARFPDKERHQIFLEPEGATSPEVYPSGIPTSLPYDVQKALVASIPGLERAQIVRPGYAIEYDFAFPTQLAPTLETKCLPGLWLAGQINGTSGYEEAAAQGLWAALNVAQSLRGADPFLPGRDQAYMAVLVDDLVTKGTLEPYRMFTSRAEHRLLLREGNADTRLTPLGRGLGLVNDERWDAFSAKQKAIAALVKAIAETPVNQDAGEFLRSVNAVPPASGAKLEAILRQPPVTLDSLAPLCPAIAGAPEHVRRETETIIKYAGYLDRQQELVTRSRKLESVPLPPDLDYAAVAGLSREAVEKLASIQPRSLGQAGRIQGITPAAVACLEIHLKKAGLL